MRLIRFVGFAVGRRDGLLVGALLAVVGLIVGVVLVGRDEGLAVVGTWVEENDVLAVVGLFVGAVLVGRDEGLAVVGTWVGANDGLDALGS